MLGYRINWQSSIDGVFWSDDVGETANSRVCTNVERGTHDQMHVRIAATKNGVTVYSDLATLSVWNPTVYEAELFAWLNPRKARYQQLTSASPTTPSVIGDPVGTWVSHDTLTTCGIGANSRRPTAVQAGLHFDNVDDGFVFGRTLFRNTERAYLIIGFKPDSKTTIETLFIEQIGTGTLHKVSIQLNYTTQWRIRLLVRREDGEASGTQLAVNSYFSPEEEIVLTAELLWADGIIRLYKNNTLVGSNTLPTSGPTSNDQDSYTTLAHERNANLFDGVIRDIVIVKPTSELTESQRNELINFVGSRSGI